MSQYALLGKSGVESRNGSEGSQEPFLEKEQILAHKRRLPFSRFDIIRSALEVFLVALVGFLAIKLMLLSRSVAHKNAQSHNNSPSFIPHFPEIEVEFQPDARFARAESFLSSEKLFESLKQWKPLSPRARGAIDLNATERIGFPPPYTKKIDEADEDPEFYMISGFHQLHCLYSLMKAYGKLALNGTKATPSHIAHYVEYLRQGILCAGDMAIEGKTKDEEGWGVTHQCRDMSAVIKWADTRPGIPPEHYDKIDGL